MNIDIKIDNYFKLKSSQKIIENYILKSNVTPKNIYTENTNFLDRYKLELIFLNEVLSTIPEKEEIFEQIKELNEFYPFLKTLPSILDFSEEKTEIYIFREVPIFFNRINPREFGEYYSNENLINILLNNFSNKFSSTTKVVDPSCGGGFFLYHYLKRIFEKEKNININDIKENIHGFDIFPFPIILCKILLGTLIKSYNPKIEKPFHFENIKIQNTLSTLKCISDDTTFYDLIIGNPPYFRIDPNEKNNICKCVSFGHNYIHSLFLHWSIQHLNERGELGLILPQSILSGFYYQKLRQSFKNEFSIELIVTNKEHEKSFFVQQDIMLFSGLKKNKQSKFYKIGVSNSDFTAIEKYEVNSKIFQNLYNVIPLFRNKNEYENILKLSANSIVKYLSEFSINTGNFVWNQNKETCFNKKIKNSIPLINGPNITLKGIDLETERSSTFPYCIPKKAKYIRNEKLILYRRMSPIGNPKRMIATIIDIEDERFAKGFVIENHVNIISGPPEKLGNLLKFITTQGFNRLINSFCHTNQVSSNDLLIIFELLKATQNEQARG